jgi:primosomal protein N' (replication factor Y)
MTIKGRSEDKVKLSADYVKRELEKAVTGIPEVILSGPAPAPLARAETFFRYQIMIRAKQMTKLSQILAKLTQSVTLPDDVSWTIDIDPVNLF